jgi:sulfotransferase
LLGHHPEIYSIGHSSPLCHALEKLRFNLSDDPFLLAQLDLDFEQVYARLLDAYRGFINGWFAETEKAWVVDKNRGWLALIDTLNQLDPEFKMLVCVRELSQVYGSIESQHQKTLLLDFPDHLAGHSRYARADALFKDDGVIGRPLRAIQSVQDLPEKLQQRVFFVVFEQLLQAPQQTLGDIWSWLGLPKAVFDPDRLATKPHESDSHYRFKYPHATHSRIIPPARHTLPARIHADIHKQFNWYHRLFYPGLLDTPSNP